MKARKLIVFAVLSSAAQRAFAQIPDLLNSLDAGSRAMGMGGSISASSADTTSALSNPAGLAYVRRRSFSIAIRNLPGSKTTASNNFRNPILDTKSEVGGYTLSHLGYAMPFGGGTLGLSYTVGGYIHDEKRGSGDLPIDAITSVRDYRELITAKTSYFAASYGVARADQTVAFGLGLVFASQYVRNEQSYSIVTNGGNPVANPPLNLSGHGSGVGIVAGVQYIPRNNRNLSIGLSGRTPIDLGSNGATAAYYDKIPGKLSASAAYRYNGFGGGNDYLLFGVQADVFFHNDRRQSLQRKRVVNVGAGWEYGLLRGNTRIPIRVGVQLNPKAGEGFKDRSALTFGFGYRPLNAPYSIDLNFASAGGGLDSAVQFNYRFGK